MRLELNTGWNANIRQPFVLVGDDGRVAMGGHECQCAEHDCAELVACGAECLSLHICPACYMGGHEPTGKLHGVPLYMVRHGARADGDA
jgi:hypothetical protein